MTHRRKIESRKWGFECVQGMVNGDEIGFAFDTNRGERLEGDLTLRGQIPGQPPRIVKAVAYVAKLGIRAKYEIYVDETLIEKTGSWLGF